MSEFLNGFIEKLHKAQDTSSDPKTVVADTLRARGITDPQELANVLAQIEVETNYQPRSEDARYSAKRLFELYGAGNKHKNKVRFKTIADAQKVVSAGPEAIFDTIYGGRMGNAPNEGHKYRGRGYIQLTGKNNYKYYGEKIGKDLVNNPDLANDPAVAAEIAAVYFLDAKARGTNLADIDATTKAIGAGDKSSYARRKQAAERLFAELGAPGKPKAPAPSPGRFNPDLLGQPDVAPAPQREAPRFQLPEFTPPDLPQVDLAPAADAIFNFVRDNANPLSRAQAQTPAPTAVTSPAQKPKTPPISTKVTFERTAPKTAARPPAPRERRDLGVYNQAGAVSEFIAANPDVYGLAKSISTANDPEIETYETAPGGFADAVSRGWDSGLVQMGSDAQYAAAALEFGLGDPEKGRVALSKARMLEERNARIVGLTPGLDDLLDEPSVDGFFDKAGVTLGQVGPSIFASVAGAVAGGAMGMATAGPVGAGAGGVGGGVTTAAMQLGARKVTIKAIERMVKDAAKKKAMGRTLNEPEQKILEGAYQVIREARGAGFKRGAAAGALATEYPTMTGASFREFDEAGVDIEDPNYGRASLAIGAPLAAIGVFGEKLILEGALEIAQKKLSRQQTNSMLKIVVEDITKLGVKGGVTEGLTETAQEGALITQRLAVDPDYSMDEASLRIAESAFAGFIAGGAVGGASGAFTGAGRSMNYEAPLTADQFRGFGDSLGGVVNDFPLGPPPGLPPTVPEPILRSNTYTEQDKAAASRVLEVGKRYADSLEAGAFADAAAEIDEMKAQLATMTGKALPTYKETANFIKQAEISLRAAQRRANPTEKLMGRAREMLDKTRGVQVEAAMDAEATGARTDGPAQEPVADFEAQFEYIRTVEDSPKKSMWVPANSIYQPNFAGRTDLSPFTLYSDAGLYAAYIPGEGTIISRSEAAVAAVIVAARTNGNVEAALADALGYSNVKTEDADRVVRVVDGEGRVVSEEATDALNEQDAVARAQAIADAGFGYTVDVKPVEDALIDRRDRFEGEDDDNGDSGAGRMPASAWIGKAVDRMMIAIRRRRNARLNREFYPDEPAPFSDEWVAQLENEQREQSAAEPEAGPPQFLSPELRDAIIEKLLAGDSSSPTIPDTIKNIIAVAQQVAPLQKPLHVIDIKDPAAGDIIHALVDAGLLPPEMREVAYAVDTEGLLTEMGFGGAYFPGSADVNVMLLNTDMYTDDATLAIIAAHEYAHALWSQAFQGNKDKIAREFRASKTGQEYEQKFKSAYEEAYGSGYRGNQDKIIEEWFADQMALYITDKKRVSRGLVGIISDLINRIQAVLDAWSQDDKPLFRLRAKLTDNFVEFIESAIPAGVFAAPIDPVEVRNSFITQNTISPWIGDNPIVRNMRNEDVNNFKSGPQFDAAVAVGEDVGIPIRTKKGADSYAPADPAQRKIPQDIFDARLNAALEKVDEDARQTFIDNADNMSDSALEGLERAVEKYPDDFIYMTVEQDDVGQDRVFIKRSPRQFGRADIEARRAELLPQLEALARETPYDRDNKRPRPIGTGGVTPITVIAPDGKASRPNMWRLAVIGGKLNGIESISDVFPLGEKPSPVQVAAMSIQRAITELLELGYSFEISYLDGTLDGKRASRPLQLNRRDYAPLPGWQNFPPLKDQVLVRRRSASGQITQFTYNEIINAGQPQVEQKDSSAIRIERYKEGPRKRAEARLARKWMQMRNAALRAYPKMTPAEQASATERFGDMSNKTDLKRWPDQIELANAYMDERLAQQDAAFMQRLRDQDLAFDPTDIDSVKDADRELAFQTAQAYLKDNPDDQQQYEDRAEADAEDMVDETISEFIDVASDGDIDAALAMDLPATVREALTDYPELVTVEHIRTLKTAQRDGVLPYMYARPQRSKTRRDGSRAIVGVDIIQGRIPKAHRTTEFSSSLRGLIAALDGLQPAGALTAFRDFISPEQLDRWWKIIEGGAPLNELRVEKGLGGIVRMARPVRSPGEETAPADLFRTVIEIQKDPVIKELDAAAKDRVVDDTQRRATALANKLEAAKRALKETEQGTPQYDAKRAEIRQLQADLTRLKQAMFGDQGRKAQSAGMSNTQPRAQTKTAQPTVNVRSPVSEFVSRAIGVAAGITKPGKPTDIFTASDLQERLQDYIDAGYIPAVLAPIIRQQLVQMASGRKTLGALAARGRYVVILNDLEAVGPVDDAVLAAAVGHEFGHIVFLDEFGDIEEGSKPHVPQLLAGYNDYANQQKSNGAQVLSFEEWFSDQVAAYVYREAAGMEQKRSKDSKFKRGVDYTANNDYFASIARKLKNLFARVNALLRGRLDQSQQFVDWFEELIFVRKQNGPNNHNVLSGIAIRNMAAAANGALTPSPGGPQAKSTGPGSLTAQMIATINNMLKQFMADPGRVLKRTFYASEDYLRALGADDIAKFFYGRSQSKEELGFHRAKEFEQNRWFSMLSDAIGIDRDNMTDAEIDQVLFEAEDNRIPTAQLSPKARAVRQVFDDMYEKYISYYVRDSKGRLVQLRWFDVKKGQNYSPRQINTAAIAKNPDAFAAWLVDNGYMTASEARNLAYELAAYQDQIDPNQGNDPLGTPIMPHGKQRTLAFIPTTELRNARGPGADPTYGWIIPPQLAMTRYIHFVTRKVEYERRGGKDRLKALVMALPEEKRDDAINMIEANLGKLGTDIAQRPAARFVNSVSQTATALTTLTFAVLSSLPDLAGVMIRAKDTSNFMDAFRQLRATLTDTENRDLARAVGVVTNQALDSVFMAPGEMDFTAPWAKKIMEKFFQFNGTEAYTRFVRTFAAGMGREFLVNTAFDPNFGPRQERWLAELGLTRQDVIDWQQSPHFNQGDIERGVTLRGGAPGSLEHRVANAIARFSDEAVIRPNSAMKPGWASNPYFTIVWQLKSYFYAYGKVVMGGMFREFSTRVEEGDTRGAYAQLLLAAGAILPLTMIGLEARELIKYFARLAFPWIGNAEMALQTDRMDFGEYAFEIIDRSGMLGPWTLAISTYEGIEREGLIGPVAGNVPMVDMVDETVFDGDWSRAVPVVNNL